jgi:Flp pilus assembly protein TadG
MRMKQGESTLRGGFSDERGVVAVEFAMLVPLLVVILFSITSFGIALSRFVAYTSAAREGARYAAVHCQPDAAQCTIGLIQARVAQTAVGNPIAPGPVTVDRDCKTAIPPGQVVTVSWVQSIPIQIPMLPDLSKTITIRGSFRCE